MDIQKQIEWALKTTEAIMREKGNTAIADGLNQAQSIISKQSAEIERLRQALIRERDDALTWDGVGTVNRINKVLEENSHVNT